jgi:hypothetical protein
MFGDRILNHTCVIFTHEDRIFADGISLDDCLSELVENHPINESIRNIERRFLSVNKHDTTGPKDATVIALINVIVTMCQQHGRVCNRFEAISEVISAAKKEGVYQPHKSD